jgi:hypothetical protein
MRSARIRAICKGKSEEEKKTRRKAGEIAVSGVIELATSGPGAGGMIKEMEIKTGGRKRGLGRKPEA